MSGTFRRDVILGCMIMVKVEHDVIAKFCQFVFVTTPLQLNLHPADFRYNLLQCAEKSRIQDQLFFERLLLIDRSLHIFYCLRGWSITELCVRMEQSQ